MHFHKLWDSCAQNKTSEISKSSLPGIRGPLCAEQNVGNIEKCTFRNYGIPVRRTKRRKYQQVHFQEFWQSCAQNKTPEVKHHALSGILGLLCAEANVGNLKKMNFQKFWAPVRRTKRRKSQNMHFHKFWDSCAQNKTSEMLTEELSE